MVISSRGDRSHGLLRLHLVGRAPVPRRRLRLAELYGRRRRLPVRRAPGSGLLLGLAALDEDADGHEDDDEGLRGNRVNPTPATRPLMSTRARTMTAKITAQVMRDSRFLRGWPPPFLPPPVFSLGVGSGPSPTHRRQAVSRTG